MSLFLSITTYAQPLAQYDFSSLMGAGENTYIATFYSDKIRFDVRIEEENWTLTAITDDEEKKNFIYLLNCKDNPTERDMVLRDYLSSFRILWDYPNYHQEHKDYFEVNSGYLYNMTNSEEDYDPDYCQRIWNEVMEQKEEEDRLIQLARQKEKNAARQQKIGETLMVAIMMRMLGNFASGDGGGYRSYWDSLSDSQKAIIHEHDNGR